MLVGNKNEDPTKKLVSESEVQDFIEKEKLQHIEASAKTGKNVDLVRLKLPSLNFFNIRLSRRKFVLNNSNFNSLLFNIDLIFYGCFFLFSIIMLQSLPVVQVFLSSKNIFLDQSY